MPGPHPKSSVEAALKGRELWNYHSILSSVKWGQELATVRVMEKKR